MIPKKIHYCWFGGNKLPAEAEKCIESWKKYCPDYEIIQWNESNYDLEKNEYVKYTYNNKKYAFLSDYVRLDVIYNEGGVYLDTDVELIRPLDALLDDDGYIGMEQVGTINTGQGFGAIAKHPFVKENKEFYENHSFLDEEGRFKKIICVPVSTSIMEAKGLKKENIIQMIYDMKIYPVDYFCPKVLGTNKIKLTDNTYSIHHFESSWKGSSRVARKVGYYLIPLKQRIKRILGVKP
ncbi:MAG: glycosyl transferase [Lachnospiraceae bacterium]|nr:glycosyl transferase [Lachnospiraceae bacterium]